MRKKRFAKAQLQADSRVFFPTSELPQLNWTHFFGRIAPLHVEIGMGAGRHLAFKAQEQPDHNHLGIESKYYRVARASKWADDLQVANTRYCCGDLFETPDLFQEAEVDTITMLFPDPWPRAKGERFRLTNPKLVERYFSWLRPGGILHFRTDHEWMFTYSRERLRRQGFELEIAVPVQRVISDFEAHYLAEGRPIYGLTAHRPSLSNRSTAETPAT